MSFTASSSLPATCRAIVYTSTDKPVSVETVNMPEAVPGSLIVKILAANLDTSANKIVTGGLWGLEVPSPSIPGTRGVGRVVAMGPDTSSFEIGQLVLLDPFIRARDNPEVSFLWGAGVFGGDPRAKKLSQGPWANGMWAEYVRSPLENCYALDERVLMGSPSNGGLGYTASELTIIARHVVAYGGLRGINLQAGETVIVAPATGNFSGAAVDVASALGARVIAVGRSKKTLEKIAASTPRVSVYELTGDVEEDQAGIQRLGAIDAYIDISPAVANESTHVRSCIGAVRSYGRISLVSTSQICL